MGRIYLGACLFGGVGGIFLARTAHGGVPAMFGFGLLGLTWLFCGYMAYSSIRRKEIHLHRIWMIRSFALTLAAASLRIYLIIHGILEGTGVIDTPFVEAYVAISWLCWVPNLFVAEWIISRTRTPEAIPS